MVDKKPGNSQLVCLRLLYWLQAALLVLALLSSPVGGAADQQDDLSEAVTAWIA